MPVFIKQDFKVNIKIFQIKLILKKGINLSDFKQLNMLTNKDYN